ncbi:MAG: hypothetical protein RBG13Loki_1013 [Promethearchaeota archaeon CR_4]|nr:MAG: hypothetical protein RBG13Loki_1013 [Candidatus Lokiarchaeota archaeon CR_4]
MSPLYFPSDAQKEVIRKEFDRLSPVLWDNLFIRGNYALFVQNTPDGLDVFLIPKDFVNVLKEETVRKGITTGGLRIGKLVRSYLHLELDGAWEVNAKGGPSLRRVIISPKAEKQFLYHQEVEWNEVTKAPAEFGDNLFVFVNNRRGENLGIGTVLETEDRRTTNKTKKYFLKPILDRGFFLREAG